MESLPTPIQPSAKALGKRRAPEPDEPLDESDQSSDHWPNNVDDDDHSSDSEKPHDRWNHPVNYVYDAAAERTKELMEGQRALIVNGVH